MPALVPPLASLFLLTFFFLFLTCASLQDVSLDKLPGFERLMLTSVVGPESFAFDRSGDGPYTGVSDGRILKWRGNGRGWAEFAVPPGRRRELCDRSENELLESKCGRPLGLQFNQVTGELYIADAYFGLLAVRPEGGVEVQLATEADGEPLRFLNGLDIDQKTGMVYFTHSSTTFERRDYFLVVITGDATGRLLKYDPASKKVSVLMKDLVYPNGVTISKDNSCLLIAQTSLCRILRYWIRGPKAGMHDVFAELPGYPDNITENPAGEFWVALSEPKVNLSTPFSVVATEHPVAVRLSREGRILEVLDGTMSTSISEVKEKNGTLWVGSVINPFVGVYKI